MTREELCARRLGMGKTQQQLAALLGTSLRAIHSFEQGWRRIPVHVERQVLLLAMLSRGARGRQPACWKIRRCPGRVRRHCPAWEFKAGHLCWFINGTLCEGSSRRTWEEKMAICRRCKVLLEAVGLADSTPPKQRSSPPSDP